MSKQFSSIPKVGFSICEWAAATGISRAHYYALPPDVKPQSVMIGGRRVVIEAPAEWLQRMAAQGGVPVPQRTAA